MEGGQVDRNERTTAVEFERPQITDHGTLADVTAGCLGGSPNDAMAGADLETFPADSGLFCQ